MNPLETYLKELSEIRVSGAGVKETSYYGPLALLLNEIGKTLKPRVKCIINLQNVGAGLPDGGFFTQEQFQKFADAAPLPGQTPARGVMEVKSTQDDAWVTAAGAQVTRYWGRYRQVLVTNYRDFVLVGQDPSGQPAKLETYRLADSEAAFWDAARHYRRTAQEHGERFIEYLKRVMLHAAPLARPEDAAWFLASYARDAKARLEGKDLPALSGLRGALEEALGLRFEGDKGDHFFRSTLVQTLFYGVFAAWVLWHKKNPLPDPRKLFDWRLTPWFLHVPMIRVLYEQVATPTKLGPLGLEEVLDWTAAVLNRVDRPSFFSQFDEGHAVQYFYEPFLKAFDPHLRKDLGIWYTPPEIVQYMVARVDTVLRQELGIADGLADPRVYVLDPCCGTGAYLVEVLKHIHATLKEKEDALTAQDLKSAARNRVFGFEILPAPFVVSHLQLGLLLQNLGAPLSEEKAERVGVFLTNALTGWEPPEGPKKQLMLPEFAEERDAAEEVKRDKPILVILGNPPYNAFAGVSAEAEKALVEPYKEGLISRWGIKKFNLDDLYVRFFGLAERRIAGMTGKGVVCYISNFSYLGDPSFVVLRERFLSGFDALWFDCLNGDSRETGKLTPNGQPDPSVFSTEYNREGIRVGTAIALMVRKASRDEKPAVRFRQFWGITKRADLVESLKAPDFEGQYEAVYPDGTNWLSFRAMEVAAHYLGWPKIVDLCSELPISGLQEMRHSALIDIDRDSLKKRMQLYYDPEVSWETLKALGTGLTQKAGGFDPKPCRERVQKSEQFDDKRIMRYALYPLDLRWCYYSQIQPLWNRPRPTLVAQKWLGNKFIITRMMAERPKEQIAITITSELPDYHLLRPNAIAIPIYLRQPHTEKGSRGFNHPSLIGEPEQGEQTPTANLAPLARSYLAALGLPDPGANPETAALIWLHALAIGYAPAYLAENADGIRQDWPRIPLPDSREALEHSAELGRQLAALLDPETSVPGVTAGAIRSELKSLAVISKAGGGVLNPDAGDLAVTAGWGHGGKDGVTMPGKGKVERREYTAAELTSIREGAQAQGLTLKEALDHLGETTCDIYLNKSAYWRNVPAKVWGYYIGGYQVIKKWLSYRERDLLGRSLHMEEVREVTHMARRLAAIVLMEPALNLNYQLDKEHPFAWPKSQGGPRC
ncbi:MAG: DNA methyltransferase [Deltaproteobacteria bacterium]|nr:DNA methyltransferase [Deltaproteobacteria bacterium]